MQVIRFHHKKIRARVIAAYMQAADYRGCVCFSCGNASRALLDAGLYVVDVSRHGMLDARMWWTPEEIHRAWPDLFDATPGHLPAPLMVSLAEAYRRELRELEQAEQYIVPTGSGETVLCLRIAYPGLLFVAQYDDANPSTRFCETAPLNAWVSAAVPVARTPVAPGDPGGEDCQHP